MIYDEKTGLEPKKNNRFIVHFPSEFDIHEWSVQKINKPKFINGGWDNIRIDFIDMISPSVSKSLFKIIDIISNKTNDSKTLFEFKFNSLDPVGCIIDEWIISVESILTINFGELDYSDDGNQKPYLIVKPLSCVYIF